MSIYLNDKESEQMKDMILIIQSEVEKLKQENARLREALEIYADEKNWDCVDFETIYRERFSCEKDGFDIAKKALEETK